MTTFLKSQFNECLAEQTEVGFYAVCFANAIFCICILSISCFGIQVIVVVQKGVFMKQIAKYMFENLGKFMEACCGTGY